ncbi:MAG TPA: isopentenyl phosphate kinase family protein, partial [Anaerolineae bacterium]|nr:isopentenyl phosphate kinase family protein [Anaerolineae bacterium]
MVSELVFVKLGGSLITDKMCEATPRLPIIQQLAQEIAAALARRSDLRLLLGHGSGSFGHAVGKRYRTREGVWSQADWIGFAETAAAAARLNRIVTDALLAADVPVWSLQPSASALCRDGELVELHVEPIQTALEHGLVPLIYGDVALDGIRGGTIVSTEELFSWLAHRLHPNRIVLVGEVAGVYDTDPHRNPKARLLPRLTPAELQKLTSALDGAYGVDVTGGMGSKVRVMARLVAELPGLEVQLITGLTRGLVRDVLLNPHLPVGTHIVMGKAE